METKGNSLSMQLGWRGRLALFIGKGGVGKTSLATAFALWASRQGKRVLVAEVRSFRRVPALLGREVQDNGPVQLLPGLDWINLTPSFSLEIYAMKLLRMRSLYQAVFGQPAVSRFLRAIPSLAEILMLGHVVHILENDPYDLIVLDAPSTGPGTLMLESPRAALETAPRGPLREGAAWIHSFLSDPQKTRIHVVVTLEELPVNEAISLTHRLRDELHLPLGMALANRLWKSPFSDDTSEIEQEAQRHANGVALGTAATQFRTRLALQARYLERLRAGLFLPIVEIPEILAGTGDGEVVGALADHFASLQKQEERVG